MKPGRLRPETGGATAAAAPEPPGVCTVAAVADARCIWTAVVGALPATPSAARTCTASPATAELLPGTAPTSRGVEPRPAVSVRRPGPTSAAPSTPCGVAPRPAASGRRPGPG